MSLLETTIASIQPANEPAAAEAATLLDGNTITIGRTRILYWASSQEQE